MQKNNNYNYFNHCMMEHNPAYKHLLAKHAGFASSKKDFAHQLEDEIVDLSIESGIRQTLQDQWIFGECECLTRTPCYSQCIESERWLDTCRDSCIIGPYYMLPPMPKKNKR